LIVIDALPPCAFSTLPPLFRRDAACRRLIIFTPLMLLSLATAY